MTALAVYSLAMAFVESAVVVYLRTLYPSVRWSTAVPFSEVIYRTEVIREAATIVMLLAVAYIAFRGWWMRAFTFVWIFAIWDLFYYVFLKAIIGWPQSFATTDVLFLIPAPWIAPVWLPIGLSSVAIVGTGYLMLRGAGAAED